MKKPSWHDIDEKSLEALEDFIQESLIEISAETEQAKEMGGDIAA